MLEPRVVINVSFAARCAVALVTSITMQTNQLMRPPGLDEAGELRSLELCHFSSIHLWPFIDDHKRDFDGRSITEG